MSFITIDSQLLQETIPGKCTPAQGLIALFVVKGITEQDILKAIDGIQNPIEKYTRQISYSRSTEWERDSESFQSIASLLQLSEDDVNELFAVAVDVKV